MAWTLSAGLFKAGMAAYAMSVLMSDKDKEGRNRIAVGKKNAWIRNINFAIPGTNKMLSLPVGFGPGSIIALGAQTAALMMGHQSVSEYLGNCMRTGAEMWSPIQPSEISPTQHPMQFLEDTVAPTPLKGAFETAMNMNSQGTPIYNTRTSKLAESISGGSTVPQMYKDISGWLYRDFGYDYPPNLLYFDTNAYLDGAGEMASQAYELQQGLKHMINKDTGKSVDPKVFLGSFVRNSNNYDSENYSAVGERIDDLAKGLGTGKLDAKVLERMARQHPEAAAAVTAYRSNLRLINQIEHEIKVLRANPNLPTDVKNEIIEARQVELELQKRIAVEKVKPFGIEP